MSEKWEEVNEEIEVLRLKLHEMVMKLGPSHSEVLRLSQSLDRLINIAQRRWQGERSNR